jgi:hypothetical protein
VIVCFVDIGGINDRTAITLQSYICTILSLDQDLQRHSGGLVHVQLFEVKGV